MKVILQLCDGRMLTFSEVENISIVKEIVRNKEKLSKLKPVEGKGFAVNPLGIDKNLFREKRENQCQEEMRQCILEAFKVMKKNPKYTQPFKTIMPEKTWEQKSVGELKRLANKIGNHNADWVEQALEWAQRISNGETWETLCNERDTAKWYRLIVWKNGYFRIVGGSSKKGGNITACDIDERDYMETDSIYDTIPLVVIYE